MERRQRISAYISEKALGVWCWVMVGVHLLFTAVGMLPDMDYVPANKGLWLICIAVLLAASLMLKSRSGHWLWMLPALSAAVCSMYVGAEGMGPWQNGLALVDLVLCGALFARACADKISRVVAGILAVLILIPTLTLMAFTAIVGVDDITATYYASPDGYYAAEVRTTGGLDGHVIVTVLQSPLYTPFGTLAHVRTRTTTVWEDPDRLTEVAWLEDGKLSIDGEAWDWRAQEDGSK